MAACHGQAKEGGTIRAARCLSPPALDTLASAGVFFFGQVREEEVEEMGVAHGARRAAGLIKHKAAAPAAVLSGAESVYSMLFVPRGMSAWRSRLSCAAVASARGLALPSARSEGVGAPFLHSFHKAFPGTPPKVHVRGSGVYVYDDEGNKLLDGLAGLWSVSLGYGQKRIVDAAARQMEQLPFFHTFWNQGHDKGYELAEALQAFIPWKVEKVAFTSGGSDANDTAVKMVWFYNNALGRVGKKKIIARNKGYHGVTSVAASCSGLPGLQANFGFSQQDLPLPGFIHVTCPHMYRFALPDEDEEAFAARLAQELETTILREGAHTVAAVIAEPLMGAGGVMPPPRGYFDKVRALTRKYDVLLIADEVVCGFGRLGPRFGCTAYGFEPDLMTMAKALTSSYAPMGAVAVSPSVAQVLAAGSDASLFGHGYTFGAHPVSCAVALECLRIFQEVTTPTPRRPTPCMNAPGPRWPASAAATSELLCAATGDAGAHTLSAEHALV